MRDLHGLRSDNFIGGNQLLPDNLYHRGYISEKESLTVTLVVPPALTSAKGVLSTGLSLLLITDSIKSISKPNTKPPVLVGGESKL